MSYQNFYVDSHRNCGPIHLMEAMPYWRLQKVYKGLDEDHMVLVPENEFEYAHALVQDKGVKLEPGYIYRFHILMHGTAPINHVYYSGNIRDIVGKSKMNLDTFVVNPSMHYRSYSRVHCDRIIVTTNMILTDDASLNVVPQFEMFAPSEHSDIPTLEDKLRLLPRDTILELRSGTQIMVHSFVLQAGSGYFRAALDFQDSPGKTDWHLKMEASAFCDEVWRAAVDFMYNPVVSLTDIEQLQDLVALGDEFIVNSLVVVATRRIKELIEDELPAGTNPYLVSVMTMAVFYMSKLDDSCKAEMRQLMWTCESVVRNMGNSMLQNDEFILAYGEYVRYRKSVLPDEPERDSRKKPFRLLGKRCWPPH